MELFVAPWSHFRGLYDLVAYLGFLEGGEGGPAITPRSFDPDQGRDRPLYKTGARVLPNHTPVADRARYAPAWSGHFEVDIQGHG